MKNLSRSAKKVNNFYEYNIAMTNIEIKETTNIGKGIFASRDFKKDELILHIEGEIIETEDISSVPSEIQEHWFPFDIKGKKKRYVLPELPWKYLNHSCNPNAGIKNNRNIVALRPIKKGEEIVFDYAMNNIDNWTMKCNCGSKKCRKIISTFDVLDEDTKKKYRDYVLDCINEAF